MLLLQCIGLAPQGTQDGTAPTPLCLSPSQTPDLYNSLGLSFAQLDACKASLAVSIEALDLSLMFGTVFNKLVPTLVVAGMPVVEFLLVRSLVG